jgi:hypothetical protein
MRGPDDRTRLVVRRVVTSGVVLGLMRLAADPVPAEQAATYSFATVLILSSCVMMLALEWALRRATIQQRPA